MNDNLIGQNFDYLKIIEKYNDNEYICQCICGKEIIISIEELNNNRNKLSCGCKVTSRELPTLYKLWQRFSDEEKSHWETWQNFLIWSKQNNYNEVLSYYKPNRNIPYSKDNLQFGLFINKEFFTIQDLKKCQYSYNDKSKKFVTSKRIKNIIINEDEITKSFNKQKSKHKTLAKRTFNKLKTRINEN